MTGVVEHGGAVERGLGAADSGPVAVSASSPAAVAAPVTVTVEAVPAGPAPLRPGGVAHRQRVARLTAGAGLAGVAALTVLAMLTARSPSDGQGGGPVPPVAATVVSPGASGVGVAGINVSVEPPVSTDTSVSIPGSTTLAPAAGPGTGTVAPSR